MTYEEFYRQLDQAAADYLDQNETATNRSASNSGRGLLLSTRGRIPGLTATDTR